MNKKEWYRYLSDRRLRFLPLALAIAYALFVFAMRWFDRQAWVSRQESKREAAGRLPEELSGSELKILNFYGTPPVLKPGERGLLCYGSLNASFARLDPGGRKLAPSLSRCIEVAPEETTEYTLTVRDGKGNEQKARLELRVSRQ